VDVDAFFLTSHGPQVAIHSFFVSDGAFCLINDGASVARDAFSLIDLA